MAITRITPEVGIPATMSIMSDQYPMIITNVSGSLKTVSAEHVDREAYRQGRVERRPRDPYNTPKTYTFRLQPDGSYRQVNTKWSYLHVGTAEDYRDPNR